MSLAVDCSYCCSCCCCGSALALAVCTVKWRERERETMECKREDFLEESESTSWMTNESGQVKEDHQ